MKKTVKITCTPAFAKRLLHWMQCNGQYYWGRYVYAIQWRCVDGVGTWYVCRCLRDDVNRIWIDHEGNYSNAWTPYVAYDDLYDLVKNYSC